MICALILALASTQAPSEAQTRFTFTELAMGCEVRIELIAASEVSAVELARGAFERVRAIDETLSDYSTSSEVTRLSREATVETRVSLDLAAVLRDSLRVSRATNGAFDVSTGALSHMWRSARATRTLPTQAELARALDHCGYASVQFDEGSRTLQWLRPGIRLDFGGIGKGYAAQAAVEYLRSKGAPCSLCAIAGDIACGEAPPGRSGWSIELSHDLEGAPSRRLTLRNQSVSTSGDAWQFIEVNGVRSSHIYDPRTGHALTQRIGATVVSRHGAIADAIATALCVDGTALLARHAEVAQAVGEFEGQIVELLVREGAAATVRVSATPNWSSFLESPRAPAAVDRTAATAASGSSGSPARPPM